MRQPSLEVARLDTTLGGTVCSGGLEVGVLDIGSLVMLWGWGGYRNLCHAVGWDGYRNLSHAVGGGWNRNLSHAVSVGGMDIGNLVMQWGWLAAETLVLFWSGILQSAAGNIEEEKNPVNIGLASQG